MGISITPANSLARANVNGIKPIGDWSLDGLEGVYFMAQGLQIAKQNAVLGKPWLKQVGSPVSQGTYVVTSEGSSYFDTQIAEAKEMSFFSVVRKATIADSAQIISSYHGPSLDDPVNRTSYGLKFWAGGPSGGVNNDVQMYGAYYHSGGTAHADDKAADSSFLADTWVMLCGRVKAAQVDVKSLTANTSTVVAANSGGYPRDQTTNTLLIGSKPSDDDTKSIKQMLHIIFSRYVTDDEVAAIYAQFKAYPALFGVTV